MILLKEIYKINFKLPLSPKNLLQEIMTQNLVDVFPNVSISLRIFMAKPISAADAKKLNISSDIARTLNYIKALSKNL